MRLNVRLQEPTGWLVSSRLPVCLACRLLHATLAHLGLPLPGPLWGEGMNAHTQTILARERERGTDRETREKGKKQQRAAAGLSGLSHASNLRPLRISRNSKSSIQNLTWLNTRDLRRREPEKSGIAYLSLQYTRTGTVLVTPRRPPSSRFPNLAGRAGGKARQREIRPMAQQIHTPQPRSYRPQCPRRLVDGRRRTGLTA